MASVKTPLRSLSGDPAAGDLTAARRVLAAASEALKVLADTLDGDFTRAVEFVDYAIRLLEGQGHTEKLDRWLHRRARLQHKIARTSY